MITCLCCLIPFIPNPNSNGVTVTWSCCMTLLLYFKTPLDLPNSSQLYDRPQINGNSVTGDGGGVHSVGQIYMSNSQVANILVRVQASGSSTISPRNLEYVRGKSLLR